MTASTGSSVHISLHQPCLLNTLPYHTDQDILSGVPHTQLLLHEHMLMCTSTHLCLCLKCFAGLHSNMELGLLSSGFFKFLKYMQKLHNKGISHLMTSCTSKGPLKLGSVNHLYYFHYTNNTTRQEMGTIAYSSSQ